MKTMLLALLAIGLPLSVQAQDNDKDKTAIIEAIENFAQGADNQNPERVAQSLHPQSWQYLPSKEGVMAFSQEQYLGMLKAKKIGGTERTMDVESIDITEGYIASARVRLQKGERVFLHQMGLMKVDASWKIMSVLTLVGNE